MSEGFTEFDDHEGKSTKDKLWDFIMKHKIWVLASICGVAILITIIVVAVTVPNKGNSNPTEKPVRYLCLDKEGKKSQNCYGVWFYDAQKYDAKTNADWLEQHGMNFVFMSATVRTSEGRASLIENSKELEKRGIALHVMTLEDTGYINDPQEGVDTINEILDFITTSNLTIAGIHIDVEPHALDEWNKNKNEIFQKYLTLLDQLRPAMDKQPNLLFSAAVAWWYSQNSAAGEFENGRGTDLVNDKRLHMLVPMIYWEDGKQLDRTDKVIERASFYIHDGADTCAGIRVDEHKNFDQAVADIQSGLSGNSDTKEHFHGVVVFENRYFTDWPTN